jgi:predicted permease
MFTHNLTLAYRNFKRYSGTFFINLIGLSTGLACSLFIFLWVRDELNVDKFHEKDRQLFQVMENRKTADGVKTNPHTAGLVAEALAKELPEVEYAVAGRLRDEKKTLSVGDKSIKGTVIYASQDFFKAFSYPLVQGDKSQVLEDKNAMVISRELAMNLFNTTENVVGKTVEVQHEKQYQVSGIFEGTPAMSSVQFDFVLTFDEYKDVKPIVLDWRSNSTAAYLVLRDGTNVNRVNAKIADLIKRQTGELDRSLFLQQYSNNYLYGTYENGVQKGGRVEYVKLFSIIALFILLIACINFMNLSTAKAATRMKEVGVKKAIGASRSTLILQYLSESTVLTVLSLLLAIISAALLLPQFNIITGKQLTLHFDSELILSLLAIVLVTGLLAGSYPALYLSGFKPVMVLKGKLNPSVGDAWARKGLVVFQFTLSVIFIVSVLVVYKQIEYVQTTNLGYTKDNIVYFEMEGRVEEMQESFLSQVKGIPGIVNASSIGDDIVASGQNTIMALDWPGKTADEKIVFESRPVNYEMIEMLGIQMKEGRAFSRRFGADSSKIIFNETAIKAMRLQDPVGKGIKIQGMPFEIVGVVKDFHFASLHEEIKPLFFVLRPTWTHLLMVRIEAGKEKETIGKLEELYRTFNPGFVFNYQYLDQQYQAQYAAEQRVATLSRYFAGLAIVISCLGLFGLATFTAQRKRKEIGIRKILGSSETSIIYLLSGSFTKLVFTAVLIALPVSYLMAQQWLDSFAYRIPLKPWYFLAAGLLALLVAWATVGIQAVKASRIDPVRSLKEE